jgi:hypothetical protein
MNTRTLVVCLLVISASLSTSIARADVPIINASFETLPAGGLNIGGCGTGCSYNTGAIPGWTISPVGANEGEFQPGSSSGNFAYFNYVPDGITVGYSNGGMISQTLSTKVQAGELYTLYVDLGNRNDGYANQGSADLLINGTHYAATGVEAAAGTWTTWTASYVGRAADAGQFITIELNTVTAQGDYDNVRLTAPEPTALSLMGMMGAALLGFASILKRKLA